MPSIQNIIVLNFLELYCLNVPDPVGNLGVVRTKAYKTLEIRCPELVGKFGVGDLETYSILESCTFLDP